MDYCKCVYFCITKLIGMVTLIKACHLHDIEFVKLKIELMPQLGQKPPHCKGLQLEIPINPPIENGNLN